MKTLRMYFVGYLFLFLFNVAAPAQDAPSISLNEPDLVNNLSSSFPRNSAGICAYIKLESLSDENLTTLKEIYTLVTSSDEHLIVVVEDGIYSTQHIYANKNGWIIVYYREDISTARLIDDGQVEFKTLLRSICNYVGHTYVENEEGYYHFNYPAATGIFAAYEEDDRSEADDSIFEVTIPDTYTIVEVSYYLKDDHYTDRAYFNGIILSGSAITTFSAGVVNRFQVVDNSGNPDSFWITIVVQ